MFHLPEEQNAGCQRFLDEIELAPGELILREELLAEVSVESRRHAESCTDCSNALEELIVTREALRPMREVLRAIEGMGQLGKNGLRYPFPPYGAAMDPAFGMAKSYG